MFAKLRELLSMGESSPRFLAIAEHINQWDEPDTLEMAIDYAKQHMTSYKDHVRTLDMNFTWPTFPKGEPLPSIRLIQSLSTFWLDHMSQESAMVLACHPMLQHIKRFNLERLHLEPKALMEIMMGPLQPTHLELGWNKIDNFGVGYITENPKSLNLVRLCLNHNLLGDQAIYRIAGSGYLKKLTDLSLQNNPISRKGWDAIAHSPHLSNSAKYMALPSGQYHINPVSR